MNNPYAGVTTHPPNHPPEFKEDVYDLAEGRVVFRWPAKLTKESAEELRDWFQLLLRKIERLTGAGVESGGTGGVAVPPPADE